MKLSNIVTIRLSNMAYTQGKIQPRQGGVTTNKLIKLYLTIALVAMVSLVASASASSLTLSATMPQILSVQFPVSNNFGNLIPGNTVTADNQVHIDGNCNWALSVYAQDDGYGTPTDI